MLATAEATGVSFRWAARPAFDEGSNLRWYLPNFLPSCPPLSPPHLAQVDSNDGFWVKTVGEGGDSNPEMLATKGYVNAILKTQGSQTTFAINKLEQDASSKIDSNGDDIATLKEQLARANAEIASMKGDLQSAVQTIADFMAEADDDDGICTAKVYEMQNLRNESLFFFLPSLFFFLYLLTWQGVYPA